MNHDVLVRRYKPALKKILMGFKSGLKFKQLRDVIFVGTKESMPDVEFKIGLLFHHDKQPPELVMVLTYRADMTNAKPKDPKDPKAAGEFEELWDEVDHLTKEHKGKDMQSLLVQGTADRWSKQWSFDLPVVKS